MGLGPILKVEDDDDSSNPLVEEARAIKSCYSCHMQRAPKSTCTAAMRWYIDTAIHSTQKCEATIKTDMHLKTDMHCAARFRGQSITANSTQTSTCALPTLPSSDSMCVGSALNMIFLHLYLLPSCQSNVSVKYHPRHFWGSFLVLWIFLPPRREKGVWEVGQCVIIRLPGP